MYIDKELELSDAQALTATAASTNSIDQGVANRDIGGGDQLYLVVQATTAMTGTSPTFQVALQADEDVAFGSPRTVIQSGVYAALADGDQVILPIPPGVDERYLRANFTLGGTTPAVTVDAFVTRDVQRWKAHADAL